MINSMRAMGYSFESALADIVDNSVAAGAGRIEIICPTADDAEPYICILDNGHGMSRDKLIESMRYACRNPDNERAKGDLGRFGLGMKTASLSQCRRLTVVSKTSKGVTGTVLDGAGYAVGVPLWQISSHLKTGKLELVLEIWRIAARPVWLLKHPHTEHNTHIRRLEQYLIECWAQTEGPDAARRTFARMSLTDAH